MKTSSQIAGRIVALLLVIGLFLPIAGSGASGCGATGAPPVSIPAPAPARLRVTSPDQDGNVTVTGSANAVTGGNSVRVTNSASSAAPLQVFLDLLIRSAWAQAARVTVTSNADGSFSAQIEAKVGDTLSLVQIDQATAEESDPTELTVPANSPPLGFSPAAVTVDGAGRGYAIGSSGGAGLLAVIDLASDTVVSTVPLTTNTPGSIVFDPTSNRLIVTDTTNNRVVFVGVADPTIQTSLAITAPQAVAVDTTTNRAVVVTRDATASIVLINLATDTVFATGTITNAVNPAAVYQGSPAVDAGGGHAVIVSNFDDGSSQIATKDLTIPALINFNVIADSSLQGVAMVNANQAIAVDAGGNQAFFADLLLVAAPVPLAIGNGPRKVVVDVAGNRALVTNFDDHTVSIIDLASRTVIDTTDVGINPEGVTFFSLGSLTLVGNTGNDSVTIVR